MLNLESNPPDSIKNNNTKIQFNNILNFNIIYYLELKLYIKG
jgi:hypothetical protein